jgi:hypothetical protein
MGNCQPASRRRRSRRQSAEASATPSQPSSGSTQPTNSTSTGAQDAHPHDGLPISQSSRSATESLRAPSQGSTDTSNRLLSPPQAPLNRTNAATQSNSANLAEPQNVMAQPTHQAILERAGAQIGQPATNPTRAESPALLSRLGNMALREERMMQRADSTIVRTAPEGSRVVSLNLNARRRRATGTDSPSLVVERAPVQAATARGMAPTTEPIVELISRPATIRFQVQFPAAQATSPQFREGETTHNLVSRMIADRNAAVPDDHSRMFNHGYNRQDRWLLTHEINALPMIGMADPPFAGKS